MKKDREKKEIVITEHFPENQTEEERAEIIRQIAMAFLSIAKKSKG